MINFFEQYTPGNTAVVTPPQWHYLQTGYLKNLEKVQEFYKLYPIAVNAGHFLIRLLESIDVDMDTPINKYYKYVEAKAQNLSMSLGMTSAIAKGEMFKGLFYGPGNTEVLLSVDIYTNPEETYKNWENVSAVYPLLHPKSDMDFILPFGEKTSGESGLCVIAVNIPQLAMQYRAFRDAQVDNLSGISKSIQQFIGGYVIPNMLPAQTDLALFNRVYNRLFKMDDGTNRVYRKHSFNLPFYDAHLDVAIDHILENISKGELEFDHVLKSIPAILNKDMLEVLVMPDVTATTQVDWALCATRLKAVNFLIKADRGYAAMKNQAILNQIIRIYRNNNVGNMIHAQFPRSIVSELNDYMDIILSA